jgi:DNA ligase-1
VRNKELQARYGRKEYEGLDGELTDGPPNGEDVFHRTSKIVTKADADASAVQFNVIDWYFSAANFRGKEFPDLRHRISMWVPTSGCLLGICIIPQTFIESIAQLKTYEDKCLKQGFEGAMLRRADQGVYPQKTDRHGKPLKENRSSLSEFYLVRMKRFEQTDAVIVAVHPLKHNANEERTGAGKRSSKKAGMIVDASRVGSATLRDIKTGKLFDTTIGAEKLRSWSGWKDKKRWFGVTVRYKYQVCGTVDKPRINTCSFAELGVK